MRVSHHPNTYNQHRRYQYLVLAFSAMLNHFLVKVVHRLNQAVYLVEIVKEMG